MASHPTVRQAGSTSTSSAPESRAGSSRPVPRKRFGQHFLSDRNIIRRIVDAAGLTAADTVLEVGPGPGDLTEELLARVGRVTAVELDRDLAQSLRLRFEGRDTLNVIEGDALELDPGTVFGRDRDYVVVANLPYNVGTAIVRHLLESDRPPSRLVVMLQKEVAESMLARPGHMSLLGIGVQVYATGRKCFDVAPGAFYPPPKVRSTVIRLDVLPRPLVQEDEIDLYFRVARAGFSAPRKQLRNSLARGLGIPAASAARAVESAGLDPASRPQQLSIEDWLALTRALHA
jgi:16S rRNA (adenine1518-N6/adenine1519-N6)-dimethyltransferase